MNEPKELILVRDRRLNVLRIMEDGRQIYKGIASDESTAALKEILDALGYSVIERFAPLPPL